MSQIFSTLKTPKKGSQARNSKKTPKKRNVEQGTSGFHNLDGPLLSPPASQSQPRTSQKTPRKRNREPDTSEFSIVDIPLLSPKTPQRLNEDHDTPSKKQSAEKKKLMELFEDETLRDTIIKEKAKHRLDREYDVHALSYREAGKIHPTYYVLCDHEMCRGNLDFGLYAAVGRKSKSRTLDAAQVARHEIRRHFNLRKEFLAAAAEAVVKCSLPLDIWAHPAMKKAIGILNSTFSDGVSRHIIEKHIGMLEGEITESMKKLVTQLASQNRLAVVLDNYDHQGAKYCGIVLCAFTTDGKCLRWFLSFKRVHDATDKGMRAHLREILSQIGLSDQFDRKILPIVGDFPMQNAFKEWISAGCCAHTLANIIKSFLKKCAEEWFKNECEETMAAVSAFISMKKRDGCEFQSLNEEIEQHQPVGHDGKRIRKLEGLNFIRFRSVFNLFDRLLDAKDFVNSNNRLLYANGHNVSWPIVEYMVEIGKIFMAKIDQADSDQFMVTDTLFTMQELLVEVLEFKPSDERFMSVHRELIMSVCDYLYGNKATRRYKGVGKDIPSRADGIAVLALVLDFTERDLTFHCIRDAMTVAKDNGVLTSEDEILLREILTNAQTHWETLADETAEELLKRLDERIESDESVTDGSQDLFPSESDVPPRKRSRMEEKYLRRLGAKPTITKSSIRSELDKWRNEGEVAYRDWFYSEDQEAIRYTPFVSVRIKKYFNEAKTTYPKLSKIAGLLSATPGTSSGIERLFSRCTMIMTPSRSLLDTETIEKMLRIHTAQDISAFL